MAVLTKNIQKKLERLKVLIVDDQPEVRSLMREIMAGLGIKRTFEAANGKEAMVFMDADLESVNLIVCDWRMPAMTGIDFLKQVRAGFPNIPFLMVTGKSDKVSVMEAKTAGVSAFICKPFSPEQLEQKIKYLANGAATTKAKNRLHYQ